MTDPASPTAVPSTAVPPGPSPSPLLPTTAALLLARTAAAQHQGRLPSLVSGVVRDGGLVWSAGRGTVGVPVSADDPVTDVQYRLGSISKTLTAVLVMRLRDEGLLALDDELDRHVPGTPLGGRTVGQLLAHVAGAAAESPGDWWERTPGGTLDDLALTDADVVLPAGRRFHYSNLGYGLLGELVARLRGRSWADAVHAEVLAPLGMTRTTPRPDGPAAQGHAVHPWADVALVEPEHDAGVMAAAGQLWSTLADLGRLGAFLLGDTADVLTAATLEEMTEPAGVDPTSPSWLGYGLGLQVMRLGDGPGAAAGTVLVGHGGSMPGFLAGLWADRAQGCAAVALTNSTAGLDLGLLAGMLADVRAHEPRIAPAWAPAAPPVDLDLLGPWFWGPSPWVLRALPGGLLRLEGLGIRGRASRFRPGPDGTWVGLDGYFAGETLRLDRDAVVVATFVLTRTPYDPAAPVPGGVDPAGWHA